MNDSDVLVTTVQGETEAQLIRSFLEGHGLTVRLEGESVRLTHGITMNGLGEVRVRVPVDQVAKARELLAMVEAGELELSEDEILGDSEPPAD
jgi:hypothetical protein